MITSGVTVSGVIVRKSGSEFDSPLQEPCDLLEGIAWLIDFPTAAARAWRTIDVHNDVHKWLVSVCSPTVFDEDTFVVIGWPANGGIEQYRVTVNRADLSAAVIDMVDLALADKIAEHFNWKVEEG